MKTENNFDKPLLQECKSEKAYLIIGDKRLKSNITLDGRELNFTSEENKLTHSIELSFILGIKEEPIQDDTNLIDKGDKVETIRMILTYYHMVTSNNSYISRLLCCRSKGRLERKLTVFIKSYLVINI
jgi:hypothetical protein